MAMVGLSFPWGASVVCAARYESHADGSTASATALTPDGTTVTTIPLVSGPGPPT
jgi:hypothetical protein